MKVLKAVGLTILGFLLFVSLSVLGLALTVNSTLLQPRFLPNELDHLNIGSLAAETIGTGDGDLSPATREAVLRTVTVLEPQIKTQVRNASDRVYAYLLGDAQSIDLSEVLKGTILNKDFVASIVDESNTVALARQDLRDQLADLIPPGQQQLVRYLDTAMPSIDPWLKQEINAAAGPVVDYLLGESPTLHLVVQLDQMKSILRPNLRAAFLSSPPPELAGATQAQTDTVFAQYYEQAAAAVPATATIGPSSLGIGPSASLAQALSDAESGLTKARTGIAQFRVYYVLLWVLAALLVLGIILIHRAVRAATRDLGIIFLSYGALEFVGVLVAGYFLGAVSVSGLPAALQSWLPGFYADFFRPLKVFSVTLAIAGLAMVIISVLYRRRPAV